jgi:hypothetical protein
MPLLEIGLPGYLDGAGIFGIIVDFLMPLVKTGGTYFARLMNRGLVGDLTVFRPGHYLPGLLPAEFPVSIFR